MEVLQRFLFGEPTWIVTLAQGYVKRIGPRIIDEIEAKFRGFSSPPQQRQGDLWQCLDMVLPGLEAVSGRLEAGVRWGEQWGRGQEAVGKVTLLPWPLLQGAVAALAIPEIGWNGPSFGAWAKMSRHLHWLP
jgi:hypothetical protein